MKLYKLKNKCIVEVENQFYEIKNTGWDALINEDTIFEIIETYISKNLPLSNFELTTIEAPIGTQQELWACGVTYLRSKVGREEESKDSGGATFYDKVYTAERPEVFFKALPHRIVAHNQYVRIRKDSTWDVPEPELTLVVTKTGKIIGYTIGNDMSSRSIEGENPLYLPQAKTYDKCAALGPCVYITNQPINLNTKINLIINRNNETVFENETALNQMKRTLTDLVHYVFKECSFPFGCLIMTGTGIVPGSNFTLQINDEIIISIDNIGTLINYVE